MDNERTDENNPSQLPDDDADKNVRTQQTQPESESRSDLGAGE